MDQEEHDSTRKVTAWRPQAAQPSLAERVEPEHLYKGVGLFFLLMLVYANFAAISRVLLIVYASIILAVALNVVVGLVPQHRRAASAILGIVILGAVIAVLMYAVPALAAQLQGLTSEIPRFQRQLETWSRSLSASTGLNIDLLGEQTRQWIASGFGNAEILGRAMGVLEVLFLPLVIVIGALYAVAKPNDRLLTPVLRAVPRERRESFRRVFTLLGSRLRGWIKGTLIAMVVVGVLTGTGLWLLGVQYALLLGLLASALELIPIVGPWVAGAAAVSVALLDDPSRAIWVAALMLAIQQVESNLITPMVMSRAAEVHPFVTLFALFLFGSLFGFLGIVLAVPLAMLVWTVVEVLWVERATQTSGDPIEPVVEES
jgi:predicted PurR-regulated permease PerM